VKWEGTVYAELIVGTGNDEHSNHEVIKVVSTEENSEKTSVTRNCSILSRVWGYA
jgi:hypothetical protein